MKLNYRMTMPEGGSIGMSTDDQELSAQLKKRAADFVYEAFEMGSLPFKDRELDRTPEILSDATLEHIEKLEWALESCRNALIDLPEDPRINRLIDDAADALGYSDDERDLCGDPDTPIDGVSCTSEQFDLVSHIEHQIAFSEKTFGPGDRTEGIVDHITKELAEVLQSSGHLEEWIDVIILAIDGAWRCGASPQEIAAALAAKQTKNESRRWPDWRTAEPGKAIEHCRDEGHGV